MFLILKLLTINFIMKPQAFVQSNKVSLSIAALNPGAFFFHFFNKKFFGGILF